MRQLWQQRESWFAWPISTERIKRAFRRRAVSFVDANPDDDRPRRSSAFARQKPEERRRKQAATQLERTIKQQKTCKHPATCTYCTASKLVSHNNNTMSFIATGSPRLAARTSLLKTPLRAQVAARPMTVLSKESAEEYKKLVCCYVVVRSVIASFCFKRHPFPNALLISFFHQNYTKRMKETGRPGKRIKKAMGHSCRFSKVVR